MQKIRCPRCGVVNLEKYLTFPQCAGCGSTLPVPKSSKPSFFRRELHAILWVLGIGGVAAALILAFDYLSTPSESNARLFIYGSASRQVALQQTVVVTMTLDAVAETRAQRRQPLQNVKMRLPRTLGNAFAFVSLDPPPDEILITNGGRYLNYDSLPRETVLRLRLFALKPGRHRVRSDFYADDYGPGAFTFSVYVAPRPVEQAKPNLPTSATRQ